MVAIEPCLPGHRIDFGGKHHGLTRGGCPIGADATVVRLAAGRGNGRNVTQNVTQNVNKAQKYCLRRISAAKARRR